MSNHLPDYASSTSRKYNRKCDRIEQLSEPNASSSKSGNTLPPPQNIPEKKHPPTQPLRLDCIDRHLHCNHSLEPYDNYTLKLDERIVLCLCEFSFGTICSVCFRSSSHIMRSCFHRAVIEAQNPRNIGSAIILFRVPIPFHSGGKDEERMDG